MKSGRTTKNVEILAQNSIKQKLNWHELYHLNGPIPTTEYTLKIDCEESSTYFFSTTVVPENNESDNKIPSSTSLRYAPYMDNEEGLLDCADIDDHFDIQLTKSGKFLTIFYVPSVFLAAVIGMKGSKLRELQEKTQTLIKVPRKDETGNIKITGNTERSVASARSRIQMIVLSKREKLSSKYFVSIPFQSDEIREQFNRFKHEIITGTPTRGIDESIFQDPCKLHLTIVMLTLADDLEIEKAKQILTDHVDNILPSLFPQSNNILIELKGVEIMNDDPSEVDVLYGKVHFFDHNQEHNFQLFVDGISELFYRNDFVRKQYDSVKLHVTLMNSLFRKTENLKRTTFDASDILKNYKNYRCV